MDLPVAHITTTMPISHDMIDTQLVNWYTLISPKIKDFDADKKWLFRQSVREQLYMMLAWEKYTPTDRNSILSSHVRINDMDFKVMLEIEKNKK